MPQLQKIMMDFERESEIMDLKEELISDTIDDAIGEEDDEEVRFVVELGTGFELEGVLIKYSLWV